MILEEAPVIKQLIKVCLDRCHPMEWTMNSFQVLEILKQFSFLKETVVITPRNSQMCSKVWILNFNLKIKTLNQGVG